MVHIACQGSVFTSRNANRTKAGLLELRNPKVFTIGLDLVPPNHEHPERLDLLWLELWLECCDAQSAINFRQKIEEFWSDTYEQGFRFR